MGDLEKILPDELKNGNETLWFGNEVVLPYAAAVKAVEIATEHQIAILGFEAFEIEREGWVKPRLLTIDLADPSKSVHFTGDWPLYVATINAESERWIKAHHYGEGHGYILTSASKREFELLKESHQ